MNSWNRKGDYMVEESLWGVSLSMAAKELPMTESVLAQTIQSMRICQQKYKEDEPEFDRLNHLITMVGGISYMMQGVEAALNAMVIDMMKEFKKAKEQIAEQDSKELNI